jgi:serine/threonine protein kinase
LTVPGDWLIDRYELRKRLGQGGFGSVWLAFDGLLQREVALKELVPQDQGIQNLAYVRDQAENEARLLARLEHPAIVSIHDLFTVGDNPWIVMGYFDGNPLEDIIQAHGPMLEPQVARYGTQVLTGLMFAHAKGVVHRDVKPQNILVGPDDSVCLVDFGTAKPVGAATAGLLVGTLEYMAPERLAGDSGEESSDIWSLGVVFYYALTKRSPFNRVTVPATTHAIWSYNPPPPGSGQLPSLVMRMLDKDPARRPRGEEVFHVLRQVLSNRQGARSESPAPSTASNQDPDWGRDTTIPNTPRVDDAAQNGKPRVRVPSHPFDKMPPQEAATLIFRANPTEAAAMLLRPSPDNAARILDHCSHGYAGELIAMIVKTDPQRAGQILESIRPERAGVILGRMNQHAAARALAAMRPAVAAERLREADTLPAGIALADMAATEAGCIVRTLDDKSALRVLSRIRPAACAAILKTLPGGRGMVLASQFSSASFRRSVQEHM